MYSVAEIRQEAEWRKCVKNEKYFLRNYWHIAHPAQGRILFDLRNAQSEALNHWEDNRYSLTLKARQIGWSTLVAAHQFWLAFFHSDQNIIDLSRTEREAVGIFIISFGWALLLVRISSHLCFFLGRRLKIEVMRGIKKK